MNFKILTKNNLSQLPKKTGVYAFLGKKEFFYIGKANNIKERVKDHFRQPGYKDNLFLKKVTKIGFLKTDSEIKALLLEAKLIKKHKPKYNIIWRDGKNYFFVAITKEVLPRITITHQKNLKAEYIGPFIDGRALKNSLRYLRRTFPYYTTKKHPQKPCPYCHLNLCPGPDPDPKEYRKNINNLIKILQGKKQSVLNSLKKELIKTIKKQDFERAAKIRDQIWSFKNIFSHDKFIHRNAKISDQKLSWQKTEKILQKIVKINKEIKRIEAYDISNIQGKKATGSMVTFIEGKPDKNFYRKFKIKTIRQPNDVAMIKEVLSRRLKHKEWPFPDLILIDGGKAQLNAGILIIKKYKLKIKAMALAKKNNELFIKQKKNPILLKKLPRGVFNLILQLRNEAHRFAQSYYHKLQKKEMFS